MLGLGLGLGLNKKGSGSITPWYLQAKADGVDPSLYLDFLYQRYAANSTAKNFTDILTFTRGSTGTYFDSSGVMQTAAADVPRFDHDPATGVANGLLIEGARTNLLKDTDSLLTGSAWARGSGATYTNGQPSLLYGSTCVLAEGLSGTSMLVASATICSVAITVTAGKTYTFSAWAKLKTASANRLALRIKTNGSGANTYAYSTLSTTSWTRVYVTATIPAGDTLVNCVIGSETGSLDVYLACAQLEAGAFPSSYISALGSAVTRSADLVSNSASNTVKFADWFNQSEGTVVAKFKGIGGDASYPRVYEISDGTSSNGYAVNLVPTTRNISLGIVNGGATEASRGSGISGLAAATAALAYKINNFAFSVNGDAPTTDTSGTPPTVTKLNIGSRYDNGDIFFGTIKELLFYPIRVTNSELQRIAT